jgi:hypothetical protein
MRLNKKIEKIALTNKAEAASKLVKLMFTPLSPSTIL